MREGKAVAVGAVDSPKTPDFFACVLLNAVGLLLRRGLEGGYCTVDEELSTLRGRVQLGVSYRKMLLQQGKALCTFDELGHDTLNNRIIKSTLEKLLRISELDRDIRWSVSELVGRFRDVESIRLTRSHFQQVIVHRNNSYYDLALKVCELIHAQLLPLGGTGRFRFIDVVDDETRMSTIFEEFVRVFYQTEAKGLLSARREDIHWATANLDDIHARYLPKMQTDVTLRSRAETVIVDAKFYKSVFASFQDTEKIRSPHLYQMFSYLTNISAAQPDPIASGLLIYPSSSESVTLDYELCEHKIRVATVDLHVEWQEIELRLLELIRQEREVGLAA